MMNGPKSFIQVLKDFVETKNPVTRSVRRTILKNRLDRNAVEEFCPVCGTYCFGNYGVSCINKPIVFKKVKE